VIVLGVDPGATHLGWAFVERGTTLLDFGVEDRPTDVDALTWRPEIPLDPAPALVAIEGVVAPSPHAGISNPRGIIEAAWVGGRIAEAAATRFPVVIVPPGGHGSGPRAAYPDALFGVRERRGRGRLRHARSAYDVAIYGRALWERDARTNLGGRR